MTIKILMPALSPTMTEGNLVTWHKKEGDQVKSGDVLAEIETDKATMEVEAADEGILGKILIPEGTQAVPVNQVIALLLEEGEDKSALDKDINSSNSVKTEKAKSLDAKESSGQDKKAVAQNNVSNTTVQPKLISDQDSKYRTFISPLAKRIAQNSNIDLTTVIGTGPNGRIVKADVEKHLGVDGGNITQTQSNSKPEVKGIVNQLDYPPYKEIPHTAMRKIIARRLLQAKQEAPHFYLKIDCDLDALLKLRAELNTRAELKLSVNDFIIKAAALALHKVPEANASWTDEAVHLYQRADIAVAVAIPGGLITPIIKNAGSKGLGTISQEMKDLANRAREGKLKPEEFQGGTFSLSNLGMYGIREFSAIINPPQGAILAVGMGEQRPVVKAGALSIATQMSCTLSVDHRVIDGAVGAEFFAAFKKLIEDPLILML
ncbi:MAG: pyruvate dehydrogenase complex dihydrolipoamide acetyltransferase [Alphaproteobacteria bacterium]|nr:pyruvate dehydrogenase complex dihydrolipoamide acetyltransferase [Alphaproteobacteria bacterium]